MPISRRTILKYGLTGATLLALGGVGLGSQPTLLTSSPTQLKVLDGRQFSILSAIAQRIAPELPGLPGAAALNVAVAVDALMDRMHPADVAELLQALMLIENPVAGLLFDGRPRAFTASSAEVQDATLQGWRTSRLKVRRKAYKAVRGLCAAAYWGNPAVHSAMGYPGPPNPKTLYQSLHPTPPPRPAETGTPDTPDADSPDADAPPAQEAP